MRRLEKLQRVVVRIGPRGRREIYAHLAVDERAWTAQAVKAVRAAAQKVSMQEGNQMNRHSEVKERSESDELANHRSRDREEKAEEYEIRAA